MEADDDLDEAVRELDLLRRHSREGWWQTCLSYTEREARMHHVATRRALDELRRPNAKRRVP